MPTLEIVRNLLASNQAVRLRILEIAEKLEALNEYHPDQALIVAADIYLRKHGSDFLMTTSTQMTKEC